MSYVHLITATRGIFNLWSIAHNRNWLAEAAKWEEVSVGIRKFAFSVGRKDCSQRFSGWWQRQRMWTHSHALILIVIAMRNEDFFFFHQYCVDVFVSERTNTLICFVIIQRIWIWMICLICRVEMIQRCGCCRADFPAAGISGYIYLGQLLSIGSVASESYICESTFKSLICEKTNW